MSSYPRVVIVFKDFLHDADLETLVILAQYYLGIGTYLVYH